MRQAIVYDADDIKAMLAEKHGVQPKDVIRNQYSYTVILGGKDPHEDTERGNCESETADLNEPFDSVRQVT